MSLIKKLNQKIIFSLLCLGLIVNFGCVRTIRECFEKTGKAIVLEKRFSPESCDIIPVDGGAVPIFNPLSYNVTFSGDFNATINNPEVYNTFNVGDKIEAVYQECFDSTYIFGNFSLFKNEFAGYVFFQWKKI